MDTAEAQSGRYLGRNCHLLRPVTDDRHDGAAAWIDPVVLRAIAVAWNNIVVPGRRCRRRDDRHPDRPSRFTNDWAVLRLRCGTEHAHVAQHQGRSQSYDRHPHLLASLLFSLVWWFRSSRCEALYDGRTSDSGHWTSLGHSLNAQLRAAREAYRTSKTADPQRLILRRRAVVKMRGYAGQWPARPATPRGPETPHRRRSNTTQDRGDGIRLRSRSRSGERVDAARIGRAVGYEVARRVRGQSD